MASINRLHPILAIAVGVVHAGLAPVLTVSDVKPNLVLVAVVLVASLCGARAGATWAFVAGLTVNVLSSQPLGSIPLTLLVAAGVGAGARPIVHALGKACVPLAVVAGSIAADATTLAIRRLMVGDAAVAPLEAILLGAALNGAIAAFTVLASLLTRWRRAEHDRVTRWST